MKNPIENDRSSTFCLFLSLGMACFLKLQVDATNELDDHYPTIIGSNAEPYNDPLTDEGGTDEYAWWNYGLADCSAPPAPLDRRTRARDPAH